MNSAALLAEVGRALYGEHFNTALAAALGVNERTIRRWLSGDNTPGPGVWSDLEQLCYDRRVTLLDLSRQAESTRRGLEPQ